VISVFYRFCEKYRYFWILLKNNDTFLKSSDETA